MKKYILIKADTNDADYISNKTEINDEELELLRPIISVLKSQPKSYNWVSSVYGNEAPPEEQYVQSGLLTEDQVDLFGDYVPYGEYGVHTIESIEIIQVLEQLL